MINNSRIDIINFSQQKSNRIEYSLDNMYGCMDIGKYRTRQEDSALLLNHPANRNFKILAVADGMGGLDNGGKASNLTLSLIIRWFEKLPESYFEREKQICIELIEIIQMIDTIVRKECSPGGTTLALAIVTKNNYILVNVGDSRIYISNRNHLIQVTKDHSLSWDLYERGIIINKDDIRFHKKNNLINSRLGCEKKKLIIDNQVIMRDDLDSIHLFTDGVTDCASDVDLENIINNSKASDISKRIVDYALNNISINTDLCEKDYYSTIDGGKDNTTALCYIKKLKR